jgi:hypothetical protein
MDFLNLVIGMAGALESITAAGSRRAGISFKNRKAPRFETPRSF